MPRHPRFLVPVAAIAVSCVLASGAAGAKGIHRFFLAPGTGNISCEVAVSVPQLGTYVYCQAIPPHALSVTMSAAGKLKICHGDTCIGNPPENDPTLAYGRSLSAGTFRCTSTRAGVRCTAGSGHGFLIGSGTVKRV
jgi:hypothetical protein